MKVVMLSRGLTSVIDARDYNLVSGFKWIAVKGGKGFYAVTSRGPDGKPISLHRFLINPRDGNEVDHINGDSLDNRRCNLRECSHKENLRNKKKQPDTTSRFKGVSRTKSGRWLSQIEQNGVQLKIGSFSSEFEAARAYDRAAKVLFGAFAKTNSSLGLFDGALDRVVRTKLDEKKKFLAEMARIGIVPKLAA